MRFSNNQGLLGVLKTKPGLHIQNVELTPFILSPNKKLSISLINKSIENLYNCSMIIPWSQYPSLLDLLNRYAIHMPSSN